MRRILAATGLAIVLVATAAPAGAAGPPPAGLDTLAWGECPPAGPEWPRDYYFPLLASYWQFAAQATSGGAPVAPPASLAQVPADNQYSALYSVVCGDSYWTEDLNRYRREVAVDRRLWPVTAGMSPNVWPCAFWPTDPIEPPVKVTGNGPRNVLIVQNTRDPATPWITAYGLRRALGQRAAMVTADAGGHRGVRVGHLRGRGDERVPGRWRAAGTGPLLPGRTGIDRPIGPGSGRAGPTAVDQAGDLVTSRVSGSRKGRLYR